MRLSCLVALATALAATPALAQFSEGPRGGAGPQAGPGQFLTRTVPPLPRSFMRGDQVLPGLPGFPGVNDYDGDGRVDRPCNRRRCRDADGLYLGQGGIVARHGGYFAEGGEALGVSGGRVDYDYDRGYPYDHYRGSGDRSFADREPPRMRGCETTWTEHRGSGTRVPVRVCRN